MQNLEKQKTEAGDEEIEAEQFHQFNTQRYAGAAAISTPVNPAVAAHCNISTPLAILLMTDNSVCGISMSFLQSVASSSHICQD